MPWFYADIDQGIHWRKIKLHEMKNEKKNYVGFCIPKIWKILKRFPEVYS